MQHEQFQQDAAPVEAAVPTASAQKIVIEKGIPIPKSALQKYPFAGMAVGDSFATPEGKAKSVRAAASSYARTHEGVKFTVRQVEDAVRVWRIQ